MRGFRDVRFREVSEKTPLVRLDVNELPDEIGDEENQAVQRHLRDIERRLPEEIDESMAIFRKMFADDFR